MQQRATVVVGRSLSFVILEVGFAIDKKTRVLERVDEKATRACALLLGADFVAADAARADAPRSAHVRVESAQWPHLAPRLTSAQWNVLEMPQWLEALFCSENNNTTQNCCACAPKFLQQIFPTLYPHQQIAVRAALRNNGSLYLADAMGLGKTRSALAIAAYYSVDSLLVVAPASLRFNWLHEARAFFPEICCVEKVRDVAAAPRFAIVSYALLPRLHAEYAFYIFDECHYLKNPHSARTKAALRLTRHKPRTLLLSGTPLSRNADLFSQLMLLNALPRTTEFYAFRSFFRHSAAHYFAWRYTRPEVVYAPHEITQFTRNRRSWELRALLAQANFLRRTLSDADITLPPKHREAFAIGRLVESERRHFQAEMQREFTNVRSKEAHLIRLVLRTSETKRKFSLAFLREMLPTWRGEKTLVFAHYHNTLDAFAALLRELSIGFVAIDGRATPREKEERLAQFCSDTSMCIALLGIQSASTGLNLQAAQRVVFAELTWNPDDHLQAEARAHRIGCTHAVSVLYLLLPESADDVMFRALNAKHANSQQILCAAPHNNHFLP
jgi:SWI/SNF-related matrix-associated actin-dependent regulator 1 of chromatin subfamily A